ncbi:NlpC/P60 family protein [Corynebacterium pseudotuberculosis]|uniref:C40 family peptidase n=1 Tax=Corynebacterium pseudotuberculosis TaxID=1719 RepID=UPI00065DFE5E|nr:C40 family peptidase [Corynebacterium pseudotuberculosis]AKP08142.1 NlpC/P60 family protein [Corynebacterium pseudotuberculosis]
MINLAAVVSMLSTLAPPSQLLTLPCVPLFRAALPLAATFGAHPKLVDDAHRLATDIEHAHRLLPRAHTEIDAVRTELGHMAADFLKESALLLPRVFSPVPAISVPALAEIAALPGIYVQLAYARLHTASIKLAGVTAELNRLAGIEIDSVESSGDKPDSHAPPMHGTTQSAGMSQTPGALAVTVAKSALGTPYRWGGTSTAGFDCSGLTQWAWRQAGVELPRLAEQQTVGTQVTREQLLPGDLVVWDGHVAMYAGDGTIIEAGNPVQINPLRTTNMGMAFKGYFRPTD